MSTPNMQTSRHLLLDDRSPYKIILENANNKKNN